MADRNFRHWPNKMIYLTFPLKKASFCALLALASAAPQTIWPPGVSPAACPNYPICDNNLDPTSGIARSLTGVPAANPALQWPAGVSPAACPNYPHCGTASIVPVGYTNTAGYPAGVNAATCPNFPFC